MLRPELDVAATLLKAIASPARLAILHELRDGERCVHELVDALGLSQPLISQHLRVLRDRQVILGQRRGREVAYRLADDHVVRIVDDVIEHAGEREPARG